MSSEPVEPTALVLAGTEVLAATRGRYCELRRGEGGNLAILVDGAYSGTLDLDNMQVQWLPDFVPAWDRS